MLNPDNCLQLNISNTHIEHTYKSLLNFIPTKAD